MRECFCQCPESPWPLDTLVGPDLTFTWFSVIFLPFPTAQFNCNILIGSNSASHLHRAPPSMTQNWPALTIQWSREVFLAWGADMITSHILSTNWWYELHWLGSGQWGRIWLDWLGTFSEKMKLSEGWEIRQDEGSGEFLVWGVLSINIDLISTLTGPSLW